MSRLEKKLQEIPNVEKLLEIKGVGLKTVSVVVAEIGNIGRFDNAKQLQKLAGLAIVSNDSGKHNGESRISYRGRKRLRYALYEMALSVVGKNRGKKVPGFNVWAPDVVRIMEAVSDGRYLINGFRNKDIAQAILADIQDAKNAVPNRPHFEEATVAWADQKSSTFQTIPCHLKGQTDHGSPHRSTP